MTEVEETLLASMNQHQAVVDSLKEQIASIRKAKVSLPYWDAGGQALCGFHYAGFSNWANRGKDVNSSSANMSIGLSGFAKTVGESYFWRNQGKMNVGWQRYSSKEKEKSSFVNTTDVVKLETHYGQNIQKDLSISVMGEWDSNVLGNALSPSYLDLSMGITWSPEENLVTVVHPVNYEMILVDTDGYKSSSGAKLAMDYKEELHSDVHMSIDLNGFISYRDIAYLSNLTTTLGFNMKIFDSIGLGLEYAMRISEQESLQLSDGEKVMQSYMVMGISYELP